MKGKYILKLFIGFLKKNNVYKAYIKSLIESKIEPLDFIIKTIKVNLETLIVNAFEWSSCKYCPYKWYGLHMEWCTLYRKKNKIL